MQSLAVPVRSAAYMAGVGESTIWKLIALGKLDSVLLGKRRLVLVASLNKLLQPGTTHKLGKYPAPHERRNKPHAKAESSTAA
jgi:hypothetical protein